jgi:hypothetical protein
MRRLLLALTLLSALAGCGGGSSSPTGPTSTEAAAAAPVPAASPASPTRQVVRQYTMSGFSGSSQNCVRIQADSPPSTTPCGDHIGLQGDEGTRGTVTAEPAAGSRFVRWASSSSDCPGESTNPCSFAFDRDKAMIANFERTGSASAPAPTPKRPASASAPTPKPPAAVSAPVPASQQFRISAGNQVGCQSPYFGPCGCVRIQTDSPPGTTACGQSVSTVADAGTRVTVTAVPDAGFRFERWLDNDYHSAGCPEISCSFTAMSNTVRIASYVDITP